MAQDFDEPAFDKQYWEAHWQQLSANDSESGPAANPYLARELGDLRPGTALDAGCGQGAEAIWLAGHGWAVTAADISVAALDRAGERAAGITDDRLKWLQVDLSTWEPDCRFHLVTTHYAHPTMPQLDFYQRISRWVAPGGTLLIVGHLQTDNGEHGHHTGGRGHDSGGHDHELHPAQRATVTAASVTGLLDAEDWDVGTAQELTRTLSGGSSAGLELQDVVVRATRRV